MVTRKGTRAALAATAAIGLLGATGAQAANLNLNDATPGEITIAWGGFELNGSVNGGSSSTGGSVIVSGETASFSGEWIVSTPATASPGVIYIVDPGQPDLIRAQIDGSWQTGTITPTINITVTSAAFGNDLGTLPAAFAGLGVPMPDGSVGIQALFRNPTTAAPVSIPSNLTIQYVGDLEPECGHPTLYAQTPDQSNAAVSDQDASGVDAEQAEDVQFTQDVTVRSLRWWGIYAQNNTPQADADSFELRVYEDESGSPAEFPIAVFPLSNAVRAGTGGEVFGTYPEFVYAATLPAPLTLNANTTYWLTIINTTTNDANDNWYWEYSSDGNANRWSRVPSNSGPWTNNLSFDLAFELCGTASTLDCIADFNSDGFVDGGDLAQLLAFWGACPAPMPLMVPLERRDALTSTSDDPSAALPTQ